MNGEVWVLMGAAIEYNDSTYDVIPADRVAGVFPSKEEAEARRAEVAMDVAHGWAVDEISEETMGEHHTVQEAVLEKLTLKAVKVETENWEDAYMILAVGSDEDGYVTNMHCQRIVSREEVLGAIKDVCGKVLESVDAEQRSWVEEILVESTRAEHVDIWRSQW